LLPYLGRVALFLPVLVFFIMLVSLLAVSENQSAQFFFFDIVNLTGWSDGVAWMIGISAVHWCISCLDSCTHMSDEIPESARNIPRVLMWP
jgi:choline transport protein